ncbi:MAG: hypothetical protein HY335_10345 [Deinococcus sp.]|nr:hypothetical protein [Deinococcus sp.]
MRKGIWIYPWDLMDEGIEAVLDKVQAIGLNTVNVAAAYHAGKFFLPHNPRHKVYFPEDGALYFAPDLKRFKASGLEPRISRLVADGDPLAQVTKAAQRRGLEAGAWVVALHNSYMGERYPKYSVENLFGDRYVNSLCPSQPKVRAYVLALVGDLGKRYDLASITVESSSFLAFDHGYHHEFFLTELGFTQRQLLGLCFCSQCRRRAKKAGIDADSLRRALKGDFNAEAEARAASSIPAEDDVFQFLDLVLRRPELAEFIRLRCSIVTEFVAELRQAAGRNLVVTGPIFTKPTAMGWVEGLDFAQLAKVADHLIVISYYRDQDRVVSDFRYALKLVGDPKKLEVAINAGLPATVTPQDIEQKVLMAKEYQVSGIGFYNYGHLPLRNLEWIRLALERHQP